MKNLKFYLSALLVVSVLFSCDEDDDNVITIDDGEEMMEPDAFENGFLVAHEGAFSGGFGTVSFLDNGLTTVQNDIYQSVNNDNTLGTIVQSIAFDENNAFVIANVSNRLTVVDRFTFEEVARIEEGLVNPRYMTVANGKGYVTNWGEGFDAADDYIAIIDLASNTITGTISVEEGPEQILYNGTSLYISHKGGFSSNNILTVIDPDTDTVETTIVVGDSPDELEIDSEGNLWVLFEGAPAFLGAETGGGFAKIDMNTNEVIAMTTFEETVHPNLMDVEGDAVFYYLNGSVIEVGINDDLSIPATPIIEGLILYGMTVTADGRLIGCNAADFDSNGTLEIYDLTSNTLTNTIEVGLIPAKVYANF